MPTDHRDDETVKVIFAEMLSKGPEHLPFDSLPPWLLAALDKTVRLSTRGARDYAVLDVHTPSGVVEAGPGDVIEHHSGTLMVRKRDQR